MFHNPMNRIVNAVAAFAGSFANQGPHQQIKHHNRSRYGNGSRSNRRAEKCHDTGKHLYRFKLRTWPLRFSVPAGIKVQGIFVCARCGDCITSNIKNKHGDKINTRRSDRKAA